MVDRKKIKLQLAAIDADLPFWVKPEVKELTNLIVPGETIMHAMSGRYQGGLALLCGTNLRLLIVDKKPMFLAVEDVRYDMIAEVNYTNQLFDSSIHLATFNKDFAFTSYKKQELHSLTEHIQRKLSELRQNMNQEPRLVKEVKAVSHQKMSGDQARELLPNTSQAWDRISGKLDTINGIADKPQLIPRRRISKFDAFHQ
jgi:hypothetical protein